MTAHRVLRRFAVAAGIALAAAGCSRDSNPITGDKSSPNDGWLPLPAMPTPRFIAGGAVANGKFYIVGGRNNVNVANHSEADTVLEAYDPVSAKWSKLAPMPTRRYDVAAGSVNGIVYAVGGWEWVGNYIGPSTRLEAYDPSTDTWSARAPMRDARFGPTVAVANGILYVMGGVDSAMGLYDTGQLVGPLTSVVEAYDPATDSWTTKASPPGLINASGAGVVNGIIYVVGGLTFTGDGISARVYAYDPSTNTWTEKAPMPTERYGLDVGVVNGIVYAVGGLGGSAWQYLATVEAYDPATDTWTEKPPISMPRYFLNVAGIGDRLYAVGGGQTNDRGIDAVTGLLEVYAPK